MFPWLRRKFQNMFAQDRVSCDIQHVLKAFESGHNMQGVADLQSPNGGISCDCQAKCNNIGLR